MNTSKAWRVAAFVSGAAIKPESRVSSERPTHFSGLKHSVPCYSCWKGLFHYDADLVVLPSNVPRTIFTHFPSINSLSQYNA